MVQRVKPSLKLTRFARKTVFVCALNVKWNWAKQKGLVAPMHSVSGRVQKHRGTLCRLQQQPQHLQQPQHPKAPPLGFLDAFRILGIETCQSAKEGGTAIALVQLHVLVTNTLAYNIKAFTAFVATNMASMVLRMTATVQRTPTLQVAMQGFG